MSKLKKIGNNKVVPDKNTRDYTAALKSALKPGAIILAVVLVIAICLNFTRIQYVFGKKDPVAVVGGTPISMKEFKSYFVESVFDYKQLTGQSVFDTMSDKKALRSFMNDVLNDLVDDTVQVDEAKAEGIKLNQKELELVNKSYTDAMAKYNADDTFDDTIRKTDMVPYDFNTEAKKLFTNYQIISDLKDRVFNEYKNTIPKEDLVSIHAKGLIMPLGTSTAKNAEIKKAAKDALAMLKAGTPFDQVVAKYGKLMYSADGAHPQSDMGWINRPDVPKDFGDKIFAVQPGHFTDIIENKTACSIIYIIDKRTTDVNKLTEGETASFKNSDKFKTYYDSQLKKWKKKYKAYKYITSFNYNE